jgi:hypothetical protein
VTDAGVWWFAVHAGEVFTGALEVYAGLFDAGTGV